MNDDSTCSKNADRLRSTQAVFFVVVLTRATLSFPSWRLLWERTVHTPGGNTRASIFILSSRLPYASHHSTYPTPTKEIFNQIQSVGESYRSRLRAKEKGHTAAMTTDILDERHFQNQCSLYDSPHASSSYRSTPLLTRDRRMNYITQTSAPVNSPSTLADAAAQHRHSVSTDILSVIRSFALKPFKTSSVINAATDEQGANSLGERNLRTKPPVSLLKYRPLSDGVTDHTAYTQSHRVRIWQRARKRTYVSKDSLAVLWTAEIGQKQTRGECHLSWCQDTLYC